MKAKGLKRRLGQWCYDHQWNSKRARLLKKSLAEFRKILECKKK